MSSSAFTPVSDDAVIFRPVRGADVPHLAAMEAASYPADEAASAAALAFRAENAPDAFLVAVPAHADGDDAAVGFVCGTRTTADKLTHASMSTHEPGGALLCIHSVVVEQARRRQVNPKPETHEARFPTPLRP